MLELGAETTMIRKVDPSGRSGGVKVPEMAIGGNVVPAESMLEVVILFVSLEES